MNEWVGRLVAWVTLGLVAVVFVDVVMRYLFNTGFDAPVFTGASKVGEEPGLKRLTKEGLKEKMHQ